MSDKIKQEKKNNKNLNIDNKMDQNETPVKSNSSFTLLIWHISIRFSIRPRRK